MKQKIFTLVMMLALVFVAGSAMAQNARYTPTVGSTWTYTVSGFTGSTGATLTVNQNATSPTAAGAGTNYNITTASAFAAGTVTIELEWLVAGTYNLWVEASNAGGCTNRRFRQVVVSANDFAATIIALGTSTSTEYPSWTTATPLASDCQAFSTGASFNSQSSPSDGSSYVFFRVDRSDDNGGTWNVSVSLSATGTVVYWDGDSWENTSNNIPNATSSVLVRLTLLNVPAGTADVTATLTATENSNGSFDFANTGTPPFTAVIDINAYPNMGSVSFN